LQRKIGKDKATCTPRGEWDLLKGAPGIGWGRGAGNEEFRLFLAIKVVATVRSQL
jgi:hypothetical protein